MKKYFNIVLFCGFILLVLIACNNNKESKWKNVSSNSNIYIVDVDNVSNEEEIFLSEYFRAPKSIILESTAKSLIGDIDGIQVTEDYIFILDKDISKGVFVFDKEGKFIRQIGQIGHGPGEYKTVSDFTLDIPNQEIYLLDADMDLINKYNYQKGNYINTISINNTHYTAAHIQYYNNKLYTDAFFHDKDFENKYMLQEINKKTGAQINRWLDVEIYNKGSNAFSVKFESFFYSRNQGSPKYFQMLMDTVLCLQDDKLIPYLVVKDKNWVTAEDIKKLQEKYPVKGAEMGLIPQENLAYNISNYVEFGDFIYFYYTKKYNNYSIIYNIKERKFRITDYILNDFVYTIPDIVEEISCADDNGIYVVISPTSFSKFLEKIKNNQINPDIDKYKELMSLEVDSNPIIFYYERK